jgi:hypothetical protein
VSSSRAVAVEQLAQRYPDVPLETVRTIVSDAYATVHKMLGHSDLDTALDLAQLRLDIRTRPFA